MIESLIHLVIVLAVIAFIYWALTQLPITPPFDRILRAAVLFIAVLVVIYFLLGLVGGLPRISPVR